MSQSPDEMIAVIAAHRDGKKIECRATPFGLERSSFAHNRRDWGDPINNPPLFNFAFYEYRVAPEPLELWINLYEDGTNYGFPQPLKPEGILKLGFIRTVHMREVTE